MNDTPFVSIVRASAAVTAIFGSDPVRIFPFDYAVTKGDKLIKPYATYKLTGGTPTNNLSKRPDSDTIDLEIDVYGRQVDDTRNAANAIEYAIEESCHIMRIMSEQVDGQTKLYRTTFLTQWFVNRAA